MFQADTRSKQRSGQSTSGSWQFQNRASGAQQHTNSELVAALHLIKGRTRQIRTPLGGGGGIQWQTPAELDPTVVVPANTLVYVSPLSPLATAGMYDYTAGVVIASTPGIWVSLSAVPASVIIGGSAWYNMPQIVPSTTTPSTHPFIGDLDVNQSVISAALASAGSGYTVGDTLTIAGGTGSAATAGVLAITGSGSTGPVAAVTLLNPGRYNYAALPASPNSPSGGTGTGATLSLAFGSAVKWMRIEKFSLCT